MMMAYGRANYFSVDLAGCQIVDREGSGDGGVGIRSGAESMLDWWLNHKVSLGRSIYSCGSILGANDGREVFGVGAKRSRERWD